MKSTHHDVGEASVFGESGWLQSSMYYDGVVIGIDGFMNELRIVIAPFEAILDINDAVPLIKFDPGQEVVLLGVSADTASFRMRSSLSTQQYLTYAPAFMNSTRPIP